MVRIFLTKNYIYFGIKKKRGLTLQKRAVKKHFESIIKVIVEFKISWF